MSEQQQQNHCPYSVSVLFLKTEDGTGVRSSVLSMLCAESSRRIYGFLQSQQLSKSLWQVLQSYSVVLEPLRATLKCRCLTSCVPCCQQQPRATFPQQEQASRRGCCSQGAVLAIFLHKALFLAEVVVKLMTLQGKALTSFQATAQSLRVSGQTFGNTCCSNILFMEQVTMSGTFCGCNWTVALGSHHSCGLRYSSVVFFLFLVHFILSL